MQSAALKIAQFTPVVAQGFVLAHEVVVIYAASLTWILPIFGAAVRVE